MGANTGHLDSARLNISLSTSIYKLKNFLLYAACICMLSAPVKAALIPTGLGSTLLDVDGNGILQGAQYVEVGGVLYDVVFVDGLFSDIFPTTASLTARNHTQGIRFAQAILDQVFLNVGGFSFDSDFNLTKGCNLPLTQASNACGIYVPDPETLSTGRILSALNSAVINGFPEFVGFTTFNPALDTGRFIDRVFADFSLSSVTPPVNSVNAPATFSLFIAGLGFLTMRKRRQGALRC